MQESCRQKGILGSAVGAYKARRPAVCTPEGLHVLALRTEHASGRSVVRTRAEIMAFSMVSNPSVVREAGRTCS